jgi:hypothetical protein
LGQLRAAGKPNSLVISDTIGKDKGCVAYSRFGKLEGLRDLPWEAAIGTPAEIAFRIAETITPNSDTWNWLNSIASECDRGLSS